MQDEGRRSVYSLLLEAGLVTSSELAAAIGEQARYGEDIGTNLLARGALDERQLLEILAQRDAIAPGPVGVLPLPDAAAAALLPQPVGRRFRVYTLARADGALEVATAAPLSDDNRRTLEQEAGMPVRPKLVSALRLSQALARESDEGLSQRQREVLRKLDGSVSLRSAPAPEPAVPPSRPSPVSSRPVVSEAKPPSSNDWVPPSSQPRSAPAVVAEQGGDLEAPRKPSPRFRHRGPFSLEQASKALEDATEVAIALQICVRYAQQFVQRCVLFVVREQLAQSRYSYGWDVDPIRIDVNAPGLLGDTRRAAEPLVQSPGFEDSDVELRARLGLSDARVITVPLAIRGRVIGILLGDDDGEDVADDSVRELSRFAEVVVKSLARIIVATKRRNSRSD